MTGDSSGTDDGTDQTIDAGTVTDLVERVEALEAANEQLRDENEKLRERLDEQTAQRLATLEAAIEEVAPRGLPASSRSGGGASDGRVADGGDEIYKVLGQFDEPSAGIGVLGCNTAGSGATTGVQGEVDSGNNDAAGVRGIATDDLDGASADGVVGKTSGVGVDGENLNPDKFAIGVRGQATNGGAVKSYGVYGSNASDIGGTAGVFGFSYGGGGETYGVRGETTSNKAGAAGVAGKATDSSGATYGVAGSTSSSKNGAAGVYGESSSGATYGVYGTTSTDGTGGAGVRAESTKSNSLAPALHAESENGTVIEAVHKAGGAALNARGSVDISKHVDEAYLSSDQSIPHDTYKVVAFDATNRTDFSGFDTLSGDYTVQTDGDYQVDLGIQWTGAGFTSGDPSTTSST